MQCEQTRMKLSSLAKGEDSATGLAEIRDLLVYACRGLALMALESEARGTDHREAGKICTAALGSAACTVNADKSVLLYWIHRVVEERKRLAARDAITISLPPCLYEPEESESAMLRRADLARSASFAQDPDCLSLSVALLASLQGSAGWIYQSGRLGYEDQDAHRDIFRGLAFGFRRKKPSLMEWLEAVLDSGRTAVKAMELLDTARTGSFGEPETAEVSLSPRSGKAILFEGRDLKELHGLLTATAHTGINVYTGEEALAAHTYPGLKRFSHLAGHCPGDDRGPGRGSFPGPVLFSTDVPELSGGLPSGDPFTAGLAGSPGAAHLYGEDFRQIIDCARSMEGFGPRSGDGLSARVTPAFGPDRLSSLVDGFAAKIRDGSLRHIFLADRRVDRIGDYVEDFARLVPLQARILSMEGRAGLVEQAGGGGTKSGGTREACCPGDVYGWIRLAQSLARSLNRQMSELPLTAIIAWHGAESLAMILGLLSSGVPGVLVAPSLPAFITAHIGDSLAENYGLRSVSTPARDLGAILG